MSQYSFRIRDTTGVQQAWLDPGDFLYFEYTREINGVGNFQGITVDDWLSRLRLRDAFNLRREGQALDWVIEIWRQPRCPLGRARPGIRLDQQMLLRNYRDEQLNDGRPRQTLIGVSPEDLLNRPIIYPPGPLPPTVTNDPASEAAVQAAFPWPLPTDEFYSGLPAPANTVEQMHDLIAHCAANTPEPFIPIINGVPGGVGGIDDHQIAFRYDRLLTKLQEMSNATWYAWYYGLSPNPPVDFQLSPNPAAPYFPWLFETKIGGYGEDRRIGNTAGNAAVVFSVLNDNVMQPVLKTIRNQERNRVLVGGDGQGVDRNVIAVENDDHTDDSAWNTYERWQATGQGVPFPGGISEIIARGRADIRDHSFEDSITVLISKNDSIIYPIDFDLGDLITVEHRGEVRDYQVAKIFIQTFNHGTTTPNSGFEQISLTLSRLDGSRLRGSGYDDFQSILDLIAQRILEAEEAAQEGSSQ